MIMIKKITLLVAVVALSTTVFGQTTFGVKGGLNMANFKLSGGGVSLDTKMKAGFEIGGFANFGINEKLSIQPELLFAQYGCKFDDDFSDKPLKANLITVPVMVKYSFGEINLMAGPQLGYIMSAEIDGEDVMGEDVFDMKSLDFGLAIGAGYEMENGIGIDARYYFGLANLTNMEDVTAKNSSLQIALSYRFK
jgi:hypothetical protein